MSEIEVASLHFYPIKACGGIDAEEVAFGEYGIEYDREWMLVGNKGQFLSQRTHPELAVVSTSLEEGRLLAAAPGMGELAISLERDLDAEEIPVTLWDKPGSGTLESAEANGYFSEYLGRDARLLRILRPREVKPECQVDDAADSTAFADGFPILLTSADSLAELNSHMDEPVDIRRFRSNIVVRGTEAAYDEDYWREIRIGGMRAFVVRACARCPVPNVDQAVGVLPAPKERTVTAALRATRRGIDPVGGKTGEFFGQNLVHIPDSDVKVRVGDAVYVDRRADQRNLLPV